MNAVQGIGTFCKESKQLPKRGEESSKVLEDERVAIGYTENYIKVNIIIHDKSYGLISAAGFFIRHQIISVAQ